MTATFRGAAAILALGSTYTLDAVAELYHPDAIQFPPDQPPSFELSTTRDGKEVTVKQHGPYINILRRDQMGNWLIYRQIYNRDS